MSFKQAMLMTVVVFFSAILFLFWITSSNYYPPENEMITLKGEISYYYPRRGKTKGTITIKTKTKDITLSSMIGDEKIEKYGNFVGRQAIVMIRPNLTYNGDLIPELEHLQLVGGDVIIDYKSRREDHFQIMNNYNKITLILKIIISIFSFLLIRSLFKNKKI